MFDLLKLLKLDNIFDNLVGFIETKIELYKIQFKEEVARALGVMILLIILLQVAMLFLIFISFFFVAILNSFISNQNAGFLIVSSVYLVLGVALYLFREKLIFNYILKEFFKEAKKSKTP
jgi:uncharacterized membrane protein YqjE